MEGRRIAFLVPDAALALPHGDAILSDVNTLLNAGDAAGQAGLGVRVRFGGLRRSCARCSIDEGRAVVLV